MPKEQVELSEQKIALFPELVEIAEQYFTLGLLEGYGRQLDRDYWKDKEVLQKAKALMEGKGIEEQLASARKEGRQEVADWVEIHIRSVSWKTKHPFSNEDWEAFKKERGL